MATLYEHRKEVAAIEARRQSFMERGICPTCGGRLMLRTTTFKRHWIFWHKKTVGMKPCPQCKGNGIYPQ